MEEEELSPEELRKREVEKKRQERDAKFLNDLLNEEPAKATKRNQPDEEKKEYDKLKKQLDNPDS